MTLSLPPLTAIRVFEAVARHLSFTRAAAEIGMTQAAVSYQIKLLEERFGGPLFLRRPRQVELTEAGRRLAPAVTEAFALIGEAYASARTGSEGVLTISASVTFATTWLAQHIGAFQLAHPALAVRLDATNRKTDFATEETDLAIRSGEGHWPGLRVHLLMSGDFTPMLSPKLAASIGGIKQPADLLRLPILDPDDPWWETWFEATGVAYSMPTSGGSMGLQAFAGAAAITSQGVAILSKALYEQELADGRLMQPFDRLASTSFSFYLVFPEARRNVPKIRAFQDWILREVAISCGSQMT
jgi:LysR family transcriptional regulator, glycine cleavage system transcriptional activator